LKLAPSAVSFVDENNPQIYPIVLGEDSSIIATDPTGFANNSANPGTVEITLIDINGDPIVGASVAFFNDDANSTLTYVSGSGGFTDSDGKFSVDINNTEVEIVNFTLQRW